MIGSPATALKTTDRKRRARRSESELRKLILKAAREAFGRYGYAATTTRAIAIRADVSESLLFRYFGTKAAMFDQVVFGPFVELIDHYFSSQAVSADALTHETQTKRLLVDLVGYLRENPMLARSLVEVQAEAEAPLILGRLESYFKRARDTLAQLYPGQDELPVRDLDMRLGFGMILGAGVFADWLLPMNPSADELAEAIGRVISHGIRPIDVQSHDL